MATFVFNRAKLRLLDATLNLDTDDIRCLLLKVGDAQATIEDMDDIATLLAGTCDEADATNYVRKTALALTPAVNDTTNKGELTISGNLTWTALGGATNNTIVAAVLFEFITSDALSFPVAYLDITDTPTNGSDFSLSWASNLVLDIA